MGIASQWIGIRVHKAALNLLSPFRTVSMNIALPIITFYPRVAVVGLTIFFAVTLVGCASPPNWIPTSGPSRTQLEDSVASTPTNDIQIVEVNEAVARRLLAAKKQLHQVQPSRWVNS